MFVHRLVCFDIWKPKEPCSGIASLIMYDVTVFTFGKKVMAETEISRDIHSDIIMNSALFDI